MHILIPVFFNAPLGGLHLNVMSTALHCVRKGHKVTVLCKKGIFSDSLNKQGIHTINTDFTFEDYHHVIQEVTDLHKMDPIDIIHSHPFQSRQLALLISEILNIPFFVTIHGRHTDHIETYIDKVSMVFTVSEGIKDFLKEHLLKRKLSKYNYKLFVVPNGVNTDLFKPDLIQIHDKGGNES